MSSAVIGEPLATATAWARATAGASMQAATATADSQLRIVRRFTCSTGIASIRCIGRADPARLRRQLYCVVALPTPWLTDVLPSVRRLNCSMTEWLVETFPL